MDLGEDILCIELVLCRVFARTIKDNWPALIACEFYVYETKIFYVV